jgi:hypothetical protein
MLIPAVQPRRADAEKIQARKKALLAERLCV